MIYEAIPVNTYCGNNSTTRFDFNFYVENASQLKVYFCNNNGKKEELVYRRDFSVNEFLNPNGSYITFPLTYSNYEILKEDEKIIIELNLPVCQEIEYNNSSLLSLEELEYSLDYLTRLVQILKRKIDLCVKYDECEGKTAQELLDGLRSSESTVSEKCDSIVQMVNNSSEIYNNIVEIDEKIEQYSDKFDLLDNKLEADHSNDLTPYIVRCTRDDTTFTWCRVWSNGYIEHWGKRTLPSHDFLLVRLIEGYTSSSSYVVIANGSASSTEKSSVAIVYESNSSFIINNTNSTSSQVVTWYAYGY